MLGWLGAQWWRRWKARDPIRKHPRGMEEKDPYRLNPVLLTRTEEACYRVLLAVVPPQHVILAKVRLADLLQVNYGAADRAEAKARIGNKTIDFLDCDGSLTPKLAVNLLPAGADRAEVQTSEFIGRVCAKAGLALITLPVTVEYSEEDVKQRVAPHLSPMGIAA